MKLNRLNITYCAGDVAHTPDRLPYDAAFSKNKNNAKA